MSLGAFGMENWLKSQKDEKKTKKKRKMIKRTDQYYRLRERQKAEAEA